MFRLHLHRADVIRAFSRHPCCPSAAHERPFTLVPSLLVRFGPCNKPGRRVSVTHFLSIYPPTVWIVLLAAGLVIGLLAGLLGVGGGIIAVPVLLDVFNRLGMPDTTAAPLAIGTAQASVLFASVTAVLAHWRGGTIDRALVKAWLPALMVGVATGLSLGPFAPAKVLTGIFAVVAALLGLKMALGNSVVLSRKQPTGAAAQIAPALVGTLAAALGVGGGTLSTPVLSLFSFPIRQAIGAGALFNLIIALPATITFLAQGCGVAGKPADAVGNIVLFCVAALSLPALFVAPAAARWSARVPLVLLRRLFALCLVAIAFRLLLRL